MLPCSFWKWIAKVKHNWWLRDHFANVLTPVCRNRTPHLHKWTESSLVKRWYPRVVHYLFSFNFIANISLKHKYLSILDHPAVKFHEDKPSFSVYLKIRASLEKSGSCIFVWAPCNQCNVHWPAKDTDIWLTDEPMSNVQDPVRAKYCFNLLQEVGVPNKSLVWTVANSKVFLWLSVRKIIKKIGSEL